MWIDVNNKIGSSKMKGLSGTTYGDLELLSSLGDLEFLNDGISPYTIPTRPPANIAQITKLQFVEWCEINNKLADLLSLLNSDATLMFKWNAATSLDIDNPLVIGAAASLGLVAQDVFNEIGQ